MKKKSVILSIVATMLIAHPLQADEHGMLSEQQIQYGCWVTKPNCVKVSRARISRSTDRVGMSDISVTARNRCNGPVVVKVCFEESHDDPMCKRRFIRKGAKEKISDSGWREDVFKDIEAEHKKHNMHPPWGDDGSWLTGASSYTWIGVPTGYDRYNGTCDTDIFEDIEYEFGR